MHAWARLRIFSLTSAGSGPYPTRSPRQTATSHRPAVLARDASSAVEFAWMSLRIKMRISKVRRVQLSIDEPARGCTGRKNRRPIGRSKIKNVVRTDREISPDLMELRHGPRKRRLLYAHLTQFFRK